MKILLLCWRDTENPEGGGSERYLERVGEYLSAQGHTVSFRTARYQGSPTTNYKNGIFYSRGGGHLGVYIYAALGMLRQRGIKKVSAFYSSIFGSPSSEALLGRFFGSALGGTEKLSHRWADADVVIDTQNGVPFFARWWMSSQVPVVLLTHHCHREQWPVAGYVLSILGWFIESRLSPWAHRHQQYVTVSHASAQELRELGVDGKHIHIIANGTDPLPKVYDCKESGLCKKPGQQRMIAVSRLVPHKQIEHAIDVLDCLQDKYPNLYLDILGDGWWADKLQDYVQQKNLNHRVIFHGYMEEEEKHALLSRADLHIMPSRKEGWGQVVIEAAQHGVPTVGYSTSMGLCDSVIDGVTGILVDTQEELTAVVEELLSDPQRLKKMGSHARQRAQEFSWEETGKQWERLLRTLVYRKPKKT